MTAFAHIDGHTIVDLTVHVPGVGPWWAEVDLEGAPDLSGRVTIRVGELELVGTIDPSHNGTFGAVRRMRVVAGGGGWGTLLAPRHYHNDARLRARTIIEDAAREVGETIGTFTPAEERIGIDYVRQAGPASRVIEDLVGGVPWWVAYDGRTHVGARAGSTPAPGSYEVLEVVPDEQLVTLALDDPRAIVIGSVLSERLDAPQAVRGLELRVTGESVLVKAWCGGAEGARGRLAGLFRGLVQHVAGEQLWGLWKYRVVQQSGEGQDGPRVDLQPVKRDLGLPLLSQVSLWPGMAGLHAMLTPGAHVLVQFVEGDRRQPVVTHFAGKDGIGFQPVHLRLVASGMVHLAVENPNDAMALASKCNGLHDDVAAALDAFCSPLPVANDGGAALQAAVKAVWSGRGPGAVPPGAPTPPADVGSTKVLAE